MAITTDSYYDVVYNLEVVDRIGLSQTLDNYTSSDIKSMVYCAALHNLARQVDVKSKGGLIGAMGLNANPFTAAGSVSEIVMTSGQGGYNTPDGLPFGIVWIAFESGSNPSGHLKIGNTALTHMKIITEWDAPKYVYHLNDPIQVYDRGATTWNDNTADLYRWDPYLETPYYQIDANTEISVSPWNGPVAPYMIVEVNDIVSFVPLSSYRSTGWYSRGQGWTNSDWTGGGWIVPFDGTGETTSSGTCANINWMSDDWGNNNVLPFTWTPNQPDWGPGGTYYIEDDSGHKGELEFRGSLPDGTGDQRGFIVRYFHKSRNEIYQFIASCGLKFKTDKVYKPIIESGWVTGYTDDMSVPSELDSWHGSTVHPVSPTPPTPPTPPYPDEDNDDAIPIVAAPFASGLARYYITTAGSLVLMHISEALGSWNLKDSGKDLYKNIISCKLIKPPTAVPSSSSVFSIYGVKPQYQGGDITIPEVTGNPSISFGSYRIDRKFNDFRDYAPYTKVEIYLPYCGWTVLPSHVVGRSVSVTYYTDIIAATCKAVVYCGSNVVAEAAGVIGMDIPMVAENAGAKAEAVAAGLLAYGKAGLQTALGVGAAVATKGKAGVQQATTGIGNLISSYSQTAMAFNTSFTEVNGKNGDGCCIAGISAIVIKITRPKYGANTSAPYVPAEYGHTIGFTSMKTVTVGSVTGLLIAENVDTSGIAGATERERHLIKLYLESGIIVEHPS